MVVTVSGAYAGVGKTRFIERLLPLLRSATVVKVRIDQRQRAARQEQTTRGHDAHKDTGRFMAAGADRAYLLTGPAEATLAMAQELLRTTDGEVVVFETNSLARALAPDLAVFVAGDQEWKPGAQQCKRIADIVVLNARTEEEPA